jgi:L-arginine dehydrogenase
VYVDARTSLNAAADLIEAASIGWDPTAVRGDLASLVSGSAQRPSGRKPVFFRSVGLGIEDAAVAWTAYQNENEKTMKEPVQ